MNLKQGLLLPQKTPQKKNKDGVSLQPLAEETFIRWQEFIEAEVGFVLPKNQVNWLWNAVNRLAKEEKTTQVDLLNRAVNDSDIKQKIIDAILIPQSRFFRHQQSLEFIGEYAKNNKNPAEPTSVNIWSVGCSYGQEAWSVAMVMAKEKLDYRVWGTDVNESALEQAKSGQYDIKQLDEIPLEYKKFVTIDNLVWSVNPELKTQVSFLKYNIFMPQLPDLPLMDAIICQNVLIYFRQFDQRDILNRLISQLKIGGHLMLAPGEASQWHHPSMTKVQHLQVNAWQKIK